jgi:hypothetical protein
MVIIMIKHVVMWKFKEGEEARMETFLSGLRGLLGVIPELKSLEIGVGCRNEDAYDAIMISEFDSYEALAIYQNDPRHKKVSALCKEIRVSRASVDYTI